MMRVMVDIETLGLDRGAAILSIGAVKFDTGEIGDTFERSISRESCEAAGLTVDEGTLEWWQEQADAAREVLDGGDALEDVLQDFTLWAGGADEVWANSLSFDCEMLIEAGKAVGVPMPWEFYEERDVRTVKSLPVAPELEHDGVEHDALDDAIHQARIVQTTLRRLEDSDD